jgi:hypothetical protein
MEHLKNTLNDIPSLDILVSKKDLINYILSIPSEVSRLEIVLKEVEKNPDYVFSKTMKLNDLQNLRDDDKVRVNKKELIDSYLINSLLNSKINKINKLKKEIDIFEKENDIHEKEYYRLKKELGRMSRIDINTCDIHENDLKPRKNNKVDLSQYMIHYIPIKMSDV